MDVVRLESKDTEARLDTLAGGEVSLTLFTTNDGALVVNGTEDSLLMLVDRINDRVHHLRRARDGSTE